MLSRDRMQRAIQSRMPEACRIAIVEDDLRMRDMTQRLIDAQAEFRCHGAYGSAESALRGLTREPADLMLLDIHLPGMDGSEAVRLFREAFPALRIVMFTVFEEDDRIFASLCNGASGYVLKKTPPAKLIEALREVRDGGAPMSPEIARRVVELFRKMTPRTAAPESLTPTEVKVVAILAEGDSYQKAAERMQISINTFRNYIRSIYEKLHVHSKSAAVTKALRAGII
jgi:DNA-binding NarL/FixJ family response regulator